MVRRLRDKTVRLVVLKSRDGEIRRKRRDQIRPRKNEMKEYIRQMDIMYRRRERERRSERRTNTGKTANNPKNKRDKKIKENKKTLMKPYDELLK